MTTATASDISARLQGRARRLRSQALALHPLLAETYRRRASELDLEAWLEAVWNPPLDLTDMAPLDDPARSRHLAVA